MALEFKTETGARLDNLEDIYPLSPLQQGMLFHTLESPESGVYFEQSVFTIQGQLDVVSFERSWQTVINRHSILRSSFLWRNLDTPVQAVYRRVDVAMEKRDWRGSTAEVQGQLLDEYLAFDRSTGFDLESAPLIRLALFRTDDDVYKFVFSRHHLILDRWSRSVVNKEVFACYEAFRRNEDPLLAKPHPYGDYISWIAAQDQNAAEAYWRKNLEGLTGPTAIATYEQRDDANDYGSEFDDQRLRLPESDGESLKEFARQNKLTLSTVVQAAWAMLLARYSGSSEVLFGVTMSGRSAALPDIESRVGLFINTLPLRTRVPRNATVIEWLRTLQVQQQELQEYEYCSLLDIHRWSEMPAGQPLFQSLLVFENLPTNPRHKQGDGLVIQGDRSYGSATGYPLTLIAAPGATLNLQLVYDRARFDAEFAGRILLHLQTILRGIVSASGQQVSDVAMLTPAETSLLDQWNDTQSEYEKDLCAYQLVEQQAALHPNLIAVATDDQQLTYAQLNARANQLGRYLRTRGVGAETLVGVFLDRSVDMVVALLAIHKAGGAYVPLDPAFPKQRLAYMVQDAGLTILLTNSALSASLPEAEAIVVSIDTDWTLISQESEQNLVPHSTPENLAYVIYTSGSTGKPKGVQIQQQSLTNFLTSVAGKPGLRPNDVLLAVTTLSFDIAGLEIFLPLTNGARLILVSSETAADGFDLKHRIANSSATVMQATPATWRMLIDAGWSEGRELKVLCGGEALSTDLADELLQRGVTLWNMYGPTETTIWSTTGQIENRGRTVSIGKPIANTQIYILDQDGHRVPVGVAGELHIGGAGLARGYLNLAALTAERFICDPYSSVPGQRLYKTSDHARYLPDGKLEFLGRVDNQVKIRGFRIELGEIESVLRQHPSVRDCVVVARDATVVAYVLTTAGSTFTPTTLREFLSEKLPGYMLPAAIVELDQWPLTPNGKVDRLALPAPDYRERSEDSFTPGSPLEELLTDIWRQVLKVPRVGVNQNFFELGGHSLLAASVISRTRDLLNVELRIRDLFEAPTVAGLARKVRQLSGLKPLPPIKQTARHGELPLSFAQEGLWFLNQLDKDSGFYNVPSAFKLTGPLEVRSLESAFEEVTLRHEVLRTTFSVVDGKPVQVISPSPAVKFTTSNLEHLAPGIRDSEIQRLGYEEARESFDLERGPLLRAKVLRLSQTEHVVFVTIHHIVSDGWSMGILLKELAALYESSHLQTPPSLRDLEFQYADYAVWQRDWLQNDLLDRQLSYWQEQLQGIPAVLDLPRDRPRPAVQTFNGARHTRQLSQSSTEALKDLSRRENVTLFMLTLATFQTLLYRYTGQEQIVVGTPIAGRTSASLESLIGFFVNTLPLKTSFSPELSFKELLGQLRETALDAYANQDLPFEQLVDALQPERDLSRTPIFQIAFAFQNAPREVFAVQGLTFERQRIENRTSKFDLTLFVTEADEGLYLTFEYNTDLFDADRIERMMGHLQVLLEAVVVGPEQRIGELPLLPSTEREQVLVEWNQTEVAYEDGQSLAELFEAQVERTPQALAVADEKQRLSYAELEQRANQLASRLRREGVGCESLVAVCLERSVEMVVAVLGVLKAGGAYVPLDPSYPEARLRFMLTDTAAEVVLTEQHLAARLPSVGSKQLWLDAEREQLRAESETRPPRVSRPESLGYVIYTSGSTGRPKGVAIEQRSTVALLQWAQQVFRPKDLKAVLASTSICFDLSVFEMFLPLSVGGAVIVAQDALQLANADWMARSGVELSLINTVPSAMAELVRLGCLPASVRVVNLAGEPLSQTLVEQLYEQSGIERVYDLYGPTEDTTYSTYALRGVKEAATIGRPIANTQVYLLDSWLEPVPVGVAGELYLGGAGLARGYLKRPELTAERFIPNPYGPRGTRLYRTGDLARYQRDGKLQYLGRRDQQVKLRGYRIELGEIEAALNEHPLVREAAVVIDGEGSDSRIVAHVVLDQESDNGEQTESLSQWQSIWDETYRHDARSNDPRFNIIGWNNSYTGEPIPEREMREWVNGVAERVLALSPRKVLEIGCGTGLLLFQIAQSCSLYYGTDISEQALRYVKEQFGPGEFDNVKLACGTADNLSNLSREEFDVVILNSVVQYFPSVDYFVHVLRNAIEVASPDGAIFLGDIRCLPLLRALQTEVQLHNVSDESTIGDLQQQIEKQIALEKELLIDPAFFRTLQQVWPEIARVEIQLKRGRHENELTKFRYDVILHLGKQLAPEADVDARYWGMELSTIEDLRDLLRTSQPELLTLKNVPNARLNASMKIVEALAGQPHSMKVDAFKALTAGFDRSSGVDPEGVWALEQELPYTVEITWPESGSLDTFDVTCKRHGHAVHEVSRQVVREPNWTRFANQPLQSEASRDLSPLMRGFLAERLPDHMIPSVIRQWRELPLTTNGKVDRAALRASSISNKRSAATPFVSPETPLELSLASIWSEVLRIERIGTADNFFGMGGHSLLATQVVSRIRNRLGVNLPLQTLFKAPTVAELAKEVSELQLQSPAAWEMPITSSASQNFLPELEEMSENELDALLYRVLADADERDGH
jgi:amino acid adenylation domain-containing protein